MQPRKKKKKNPTKHRVRFIEIWVMMTLAALKSGKSCNIGQLFFGFLFSSSRTCRYAVMMDSKLCSTACTRVEAHLTLVMFGPHSILKKEDGRKQKNKKTKHSFTSQESDFGFGLPLHVNERTLGDSSPPTIGGGVKKVVWQKRV